MMRTTECTRPDQVETETERRYRLSSDAGHELRTPLTALRLHLEEALLYPDADPQAALKEALRYATLLEQTVTDLVSLVRMHADARPPEEPVDVTELMAVETRSAS